VRISVRAKTNAKKELVEKISEQDEQLLEKYLEWVPAFYKKYNIILNCSLPCYTKENVDILYKIGALQKEFGLKVNSFLVTTSPYILKNGELRQSVKARAEQFKTVVITPEEICKFENILVKPFAIG